MTEKRPGRPKSGGKSRYPGFQLRLHPAIRRQLDRLVERNMSDLSEEIRVAVRKHLEAAGLWPPPNEAGPS